MTGIFSTVLVLSLAGIVVTGLILLIKAVFRNILPVRWHYFIWFILLIRLVVPVSPETPFSIYNYLPVYKDIFTQDTEEHLTKEFAVFTEEPSATPSPEEAPGAETEETATGTKEKGDTAAASHEDPEGSAASLQDTFSGIGFGEISYIWLAGLLTWLSFIAAVYLRLKWKIKKGEEISDPRLIELVDESRKSLNLKREVKVIRCSFVKTPFVAGLMKPKLVLPHGIHELTEEEMRHVILHELSHVKQKDLFIIWLTNILQALHWFNPVLWYAFSRMRKDSELACDAYVMLHLNPGERKSYGHTIINVLQGISKHRTIPGTTGISINKSELERRVKMISKFKKPSIKLTLIAFLLVFIAGCIGLTDPADEPGKTEEVNIPDNALEREIREELEIEPEREITIEDMEDLFKIRAIAPKEEGEIEDLTGLEHAVNLTRIEMNNQEVTDISRLEDLRELEYINFINNDIADISALKDLENLEDIRLSGEELEDISPLFGKDNLETIQLQNVNLEDNDLEQLIQNAGELEQLFLDNNNIEDISSLRHLESLFSLSLSENHIEDISVFEEIEEINLLSLNSNYVDDISALSGVENLSYLQLDNNQVTDISPLEELVELEKLCISNNEISDIAPLKNLVNLRLLDLSRNNINNISSLRNLDNLEDIDLSGNPLDLDDEDEEIMDSLKDKGIDVYEDISLHPDAEEQEELTQKNKNINGQIVTLRLDEDGEVRGVSYRATESQMKKINQLIEDEVEISRGEYLEKVFPGVLDYYSEEAKERAHNTPWSLPQTVKESNQELKEQE